MNLPRPVPTVVSVIAALLGATASFASATVPPPAAAHAPAEHRAPATSMTASEENATPDEVGRSLLVLAQRMIERNDRDSAELAFREVLNSDAGTEVKQQGLLDYAGFLRKTGRHIRAVAAYEKFLEQFPGSPLTPSVMISLGRTLREQGAYDQALGRFYAVLNTTLAVGAERAADYRDLSQLAKFEIADTYYQRGDYANAGKFFGRIRLLDLPEEERARASFREAYALYLDNQFEQAVPALKSFLEQFPNDPAVQEAQYLVCLTLRKLNRMQDALAETLRLLRSAQATDGANADRWAYWQRKTGNQLANDFFEQGDFAAALAIYQRLAQLRAEPNWRWPATYQIGLCYERLRQGERAVATYKSIVEESDARKKQGQETNASEAEIRQMAEWRLGQIDWTSDIERTVRGFEVPAKVRDSQELASHP